jgi:hypothetical protein
VFIIRAAAGRARVGAERLWRRAPHIRPAPRQISCTPLGKVAANGYEFDNLQQNVLQVPEPPTQSKHANTQYFKMAFDLPAMKKVHSPTAFAECCPLPLNFGKILSKLSNADIFPANLTICVF